MMYNEIWQILIEHAKKNIAYMCIILSNSFEKNVLKEKLLKYIGFQSIYLHLTWL